MGLGREVAGAERARPRAFAEEAMSNSSEAHARELPRLSTHSRAAAAPAPRGRKSRFGSELTSVQAKAIRRLLRAGGVNGGLKDCREGRLPPQRVVSPAGEVLRQKRAAE